MVASSASVIAARSLREICSARSSPNTLGSANRVATNRTAATSRYFQRAYSSIFAPSGSLDRSLGHGGRDLETLDLDAHAVGDFNGQELFAHLDDLAEDAAGKDDFVTRGERADHGLVFFLLLLLGADQQEIEDGDEHHHHHDGHHATTGSTGRGGAGTLGHRVGNQ